jgi:cytochrome c peroxidase
MTLPPLRSAASLASYWMRIAGGLLMVMLASLIGGCGKPTRPRVRRLRRRPSPQARAARSPQRSRSTR